MILVVILSFFVCGLYGAADDQQLALARVSASPPISIPFFSSQKNSRPLGLPPQLKGMLPVVKAAVVQEIKDRVQGSIKSPEREKKQKNAVLSKKFSDEDEIFEFELE